MALTQHCMRVSLAALCAVLALLGSAGAPVSAASKSDVTGSIEPASSRDLGSGQAGLLRAAVQAYRRGDLAGGDAWARRLSDPAARATADWIAIRTAPRQVGSRRILEFLGARPSWPGAVSLRNRAEEALYLEQAPPAAVRDFFADQRPITDEGKLALAHARLSAGDRQGAATLVRDAYREDNLSDAVEADIKANFASVLTRADRRYRAVRLIFAEQYARGLGAAEHGGSDLAALARAQIAAARKADNAASLLANLPASVRGDPAALFARVQLARRDDRVEQAAGLLAQAPRDSALLVAPDAWWIERRMVARALTDAGKPHLAYQVAAAQSGGSDTTRMDAQFLAGWTALRFLGNARMAGRHFAVLSASAERPLSQSRGAYWQGRAAEDDGDRAAAQRFYQAAARYGTTYYGALARSRVGLPDLALRTLPAPGNDARLAFAGSLSVRAIGLLYATGDTEDAQALVRAQADSFSDAGCLSLLGQLALARGDAKAALSVGKSAVQRGFPLDAIAFPTEGIPSFHLAADVEHALVYGIARQESEFNRAVVSHAGARGLMQMMPSTAQATARAAGLPFDARRLTSDAAYNAQLGSAHLGELLARYDGSYILTVAAYNAGPSNVADWISTYGDPRSQEVDPIDWVERIPFQETRNYVQRVMENVQVYRARLGGGARTALLIARDLKRGGTR